MSAHLTAAEAEWLEHRRRLRRKAWIFSPLVGFPLAVLVAALGGPFAPLSLVVGAASVAAGTVLGLRWQLARCPRCRELFWSIPGAWHFLWPTRSCRHCGFPEEPNRGTAASS